MSDTVKFSTTYGEINSSYNAGCEESEEMRVKVSSDDKSFDVKYQTVVPTGKEDVSDERIEQLIKKHFEENPIKTTSKYPELEEKPRINDVELVGNKTADDLGLQPKGDYLTEVPEGYATEEWVEDKGYLTEHQSLDDYALKKDLPVVPTDISAFNNDAGYLTEHQDLSPYAKKAEIPAVPEWAMQGTKPSYTPAEVGADVAGSASQALSDANTYTGQEIGKHNTATDSHNDLRIFIAELTARVNALADSDDTTLDQMSEIVAYIKNNRELVEQVTTEKVSVSDIIDNLTTNLSNKVLSASMGVYLKQLIDAIVIPTKVSAFENDKGYLDKTALADKLIDCGVTNGWTWRKWESGVYECWGIFEDTCTHYTQVNGFYGYYSSNFPYPITFPQPPIITFNCKVGSGFAAPAGDVMRSSTVARCYALSTASGTVSCVWEMNVKGIWK